MQMDQFEGRMNKDKAFSGQLVEEGHYNSFPIGSVMPLPTSGIGIYQGLKHDMQTFTHHVGIPRKYSPTDTTNEFQVEGNQPTDAEFHLRLWFSKVMKCKRGICVRGENSLLYTCILIFTLACILISYTTLMFNHLKWC